MIDWRKGIITIPAPSFDGMDASDKTELSVMVNGATIRNLKAKFLHLCCFPDKAEIYRTDKIEITGKINTDKNSIINANIYIDGQEIQIKFDNLDKMYNLACVLKIPELLEKITPILILKEQLRFLKNTLKNERELASKNLIDAIAILYPLFIIQEIIKSPKLDIFTQIISSPKFFASCDDIKIFPLTNVVSSKTSDLIEFFSKNKFVVSRTLHKEFEKAAADCEDIKKRQLLEKLATNGEDVDLNDLLEKEANRCYYNFITNLSKTKFFLPVSENVEVPVHQEEEQVEEREEEEYEEDEYHFPTEFLPRRFDIPKTKIK